MKKLLALSLTAVMVIGLMTGCGAKEESQGAAPETEAAEVVETEAQEEAPAERYSMRTRQFLCIRIQERQECREVLRKV